MLRLSSPNYICIHTYGHFFRTEKECVCNKCIVIFSARMGERQLGLAVPIFRVQSYFSASAAAVVRKES